MFLYWFFSLKIITLELMYCQLNFVFFSVYLTIANFSVVFIDFPSFLTVSRYK